MYFEKISGYGIGKYDSLESILNNDIAKEKFYQKWMNNYTMLFKNAGDFEVIDWKVREWRAIKEIYASAIMFKEAEVAIEHRCTSSYYFLLYYSLFHGMLSAICYDTNIKLEQIKNITHSKLGNIFQSTYCNGRYAIISSDIHNTFKRFKYLRELFSYTPPLNQTMYSEEHLRLLDEYLSQCFQLTNLQSLILEKSNKNNKPTKFSNYEKRYFYNEFIDVIAKKDIENNLNPVLDPADENVLKETIRDGIWFQFIAVQLDHTYDEFRLYEGSSHFYKNGIDSNQIYKYIYDKII